MAGQWLKTSKNWSDIPNNSVSETLTTRRACRSFLKRSVPEGLILDLVDKARRTPTAGNSQGVEFLILHKENEVKVFHNVCSHRGYKLIDKDSNSIIFSYFAHFSNTKNNNWNAKNHNY